MAEGWEISPEWLDGSIDDTMTVILLGQITADNTDPQGISYKINTVTSAASAAGKNYTVSVATRGRLAVAVVVHEV